MTDQGSGAVWLFYKSITQLQQQDCQWAKQHVCLLSKSPMLTSLSILLSWPPAPSHADHPEELAGDTEVLPKQQPSPFSSIQQGHTIHWGMSH